MSAEKRFEGLVRAFSQRKPGTIPWDPDLLERQWGAASHGEQCTITFLLNLWNQAGDWQCGPFDLFEAMGVWDRTNREAFLSWVSDPFWP